MGFRYGQGQAVLYSSLLWGNILLCRSWEAAAMCQKELKDWKKAAEYIEQACELFLEHGTPDTAGIVLDKGAK